MRMFTLVVNFNAFPLFKNFNRKQELKGFLRKHLCGAVIGTRKKISCHSPTSTR